MVALLEQQTPPTMNVTVSNCQPMACLPVRMMTFDHNYDDYADTGNIEHDNGCCLVGGGDK